MKCLIVEDEFAIAEDLKNILSENENIEILPFVKSGEEALKVVSENDLDLIFMDIYLEGDMNGIEIVRQIKNSYNNIPPIIYITSDNTDNTFEKAKETEPSGYLVKPFNNREVKRCSDIALINRKKYRKQQNLCKKVIYNAPNGFLNVKIIKDDEKNETYYKIVEMNKEFENIMKIEKKDIIGKNVREVFNEKLICLKSILNDYEKVIKARKNLYKEIYLPFLDKWLKYYIYLPIDNHIITLFDDVTPYKRMLSIMEEYERNCSVMFNLIPQNIIFINRLGHIIEFSENLRKLLKFNYKVELIYKNIFDFMKADEAEDLKLKLQKLYSIDDRFTIICKMFKSDKTIFLAKITVTLLKSNQVNGFILVINNITKKKKNEVKLKKTLKQLKKVNGELKDFVSIVSHDLKSPLIVVISLLKIIKKNVINESKTFANNEENGNEKCYHNKNLLDKAIKRANNMVSMVNELLEYTKIEHCENKIRKFDSNHLLSGALENLDVSVSESNAKIIVGDLPIIYCDGLQIMRLFQNIIGNSIKYSKKDVKPEICIDSVEKRDEWLFFIKDNGIGLSENFIKKAFSVFNREHQNDAEGHGVGLALCKKIIDKHCGKIWIESKKGKGTTVHFTINKSLGP